ncbi:lytic transglycosylase domain-containing protein [Polymorphobacter arshaanensis]|uniref:lytic transglycosylase domain-containing protein n=1 Tax=Glacieibacterium arshaanense TaxID=2511025 RepID=UPI001409883C|nr:lytic transglycosylase domain-containing protein [Polymorphobacter arshaanensis]
MSSTLIAGALLLAVTGGAFAATDALMRSYYTAKLADNARDRFSTEPLDPMMSRPSDPTLDAVVQWDRLRRDAYDAPLSEYTTFLKGHPGWPANSTIRRHAERSINGATPAADRLAFFSANPPISAVGKLRLAEAYAATGRTADATAMAKDAWDSSGLDSGQEAELLARFGNVITPDDNRLRFDRLLWANQTSAATRLLPRMPAASQPLANTRLAFRSGNPGAEAMLAALPADQQNDPGLILDRVNAMKRSGNVQGARALMASANITRGSVVDAEVWLKARLELGRAALRDGDTETAYRLFANHRAFALGRGLNEHSLADRQAYIDNEFLAGWTALRRLNRAPAALDHFQNVRYAALTPVSMARGDYWSGRAAEAAGQRAKADKFYAEAATHPDYFYGQLATERLGQSLALKKTPPPSVSSAARNDFAQNSLVKAVVALGEIDQRNLQTLFIRALVEDAETAEQARLVADLAGPLGRPEIGVLMGKASRASGELSMIPLAFPRLSLPANLNSSWTMIHAITRQESQFDRTATSGAGARGLMQLMPATAQETAIKLGLPFNVSRLIEDPTYNVTLGAAYYERVRNSFDGSHLLAVASYNAGPGNARKFIAANGDPRLPGTDVVDWVEMITLSETRTYVQRVLENAVVYDLLNPENSTMPTTNRLSAYLGKRDPG